MAEKRSSGFRFRLPWLLQPAPPPAPRPPTQPPRTTTQTSVPSTPAQKPPFRSPGKAPAPPPAVATPSSLSPRRSPPQSVAPPPPPPLPPVVSPTSSTAETIEPVAIQSTRETKAITETSGPSTPPPSSPPRQTQSQPSPPPSPQPSVSPDSSVPSSPIAKATEHLAAQPAVTEIITTIETADPATPPLMSPLRLPPQAHSQPSPPKTPPPAKQSPTRSPRRSPSGLVSESKDKTPSLPLPSPTTKTTSEVSQIKQLTEITNEKFPVDSNNIPPGNHLALDEKSREIAETRRTQTKSMDSHSMDLRSGKPKLTNAKRVPLHIEIKDDISKFIHKIAKSPGKQSTDETAASVVTIAGDNTGALMHLIPDEIDRSHKITTRKTFRDAAANNGDGSTRRDSKASEENETKAIVNSNIQGINNSMMINSSVTERDPGVHLSFYGNPANTNDSITKNTESTEMHRAEVNITLPQKVFYDPTITEPSESEFEADVPETSGNGHEIEVL